MRKLARFFRHLFGTTVLLALLLVAALVFILNTQTGLQLANRLLMEQLGDTLQIGTLRGTLASVLVAEDVSLVVGDDRYRAAYLEIDWSPRALLRGEVRIHRLQADAIDIMPGERTATDSEPFELDLQLPVAISVGSARMTTLAIHAADAEPFVIESASLSAQASADRVAVDRLTVMTRELSAGLTGSLGLVPSQASELLLDWTLQLPELQSSGEARLDGQLADYALDANMTLSGEQIPAGTWELAGTGSLEGLDLARLQGDILGGRVSGAGKLGWADGVDWLADVTARDLDPGRHWPDWNASLATRLQTTGEVGDGHWQTRLQLSGLEGTLRGYPVSGDIDASLADDLVTLDSLALQSGENRVTAQGRIDSRWDLVFEAALTDLAAVLPDWSGQLAASGSVSGERAHPRIEATAHGSQLEGGGIALETLAVDAGIALHEQADQSVSVAATGVDIAGQLFTTVTASLDGSRHAHRVRLDADGKDAAILLALEGDWQSTGWSGRLARADWAYPEAGAWTLQQPVALQFSDSAISVPETCWLQDSARLCIDVAGDPAAELTAAARLKAFPLAALQALSGSPLQVDSRIDSELHATLSAGALHTGKLQASLSPGVVRYADSSLPADTRIGGGTLEASLDAAGLVARTSLELTGVDYINANIGLPGYRPAVTPWEEQAMDMEVRGELHDMLFLRYLLEEIGRFEGVLTIDLKGGGTLARPRLSGGARIEDASFEVDELGIQVTDLDVVVTSRDDGLDIIGRGNSGKGSLQLDGGVTVMDIATWEADLHLQGEDFEVMHLPEGIIEVSPDIRARLTPPALQLSGAVHVPFARLRPRDITTRSGVSRDVVIITADSPELPPERWRVSSDIRLTLGDDVNIDGFGLSGDLTGSVQLTDVPGQVTTARGQLAIERGTYEAYSRELTISRGQLLFSGGPVDNPGLDFEASRKIGIVTAGVRARGTLRQPELELFSDPTMPDADIISYIAFGKPQSEIGQGSGSMTDAGLVAGSNMLAGMLGTRLGLEELGVEGGESLDQAAMVLGTYLSPQIYVRYRTGIYDAINEFEVRFEISRRWSVRTITSAEASSAEILFSFER